jgi:hypothetical protein
MVVLRINCRYARINAYVSTYILFIHSHMLYLYLYVHLINIIPTYYYYSILLKIICTVSTLSCTVHTPHITASHSDISREKIYYLLLYVSSMVAIKALLLLNTFSVQIRLQLFSLFERECIRIETTWGRYIFAQWLCDRIPISQ